MGIKKIKDLLREQAPSSLIELNLSVFANKRIAIDASGLMYTYMAIARKNVINKTNVAIDEPSEHEITKAWISMCINFLFKLINEKITPVMVLDGKPHAAKDETRAERRLAREKINKTVKDLQEKIKKDPLGNTSEDIAKLRQSLINYNVISKEEFDVLRTILIGIGIPCRQAKYDGEQLCSMLCREEKVVAVYSKDTDNLAYGCPLLITETSKNFDYDDDGNKVSNMSCIRYDKVLEELELDDDEFLDLCIMCGCDFNSNMPRIAVKKSYDLIKKYGNIDKLPKNYDTTILNHEECREIFAVQSSEDLTIEEESSDFNINKAAIVEARNYLEMFDLGPYMERLVPLYANITQDPEDGRITFPKKKIIIKKPATSFTTKSTDSSVVDEIKEEGTPVRSKVSEVPSPEMPSTPRKIIIIKKPATPAVSEPVKPKILQFN
jgi:flap endonuclease-1